MKTEEFMPGCCHSKEANYFHAKDIQCVVGDTGLVLHEIAVLAGSGYTVTIGSGLLDSCGTLLAPLLGTCKALVVTDSTVGPLYAPCVEESLRKAGFEVSVFTFAAGESSKNMPTFVALLEHLASEQLTRFDCVLALGGGVVGDLAGFAAGCYLRGIRYVQLPTTLLAAVDSSVGGKTGLDLFAGKNLAGLFWQPAAVICDTNCLDTLSQKAYLDGVAEAVKVGVLGDEALFALFEKGGFCQNTREIIERCVVYKAHIVAVDEREGESRKLLNLGHTIGHALEVCSNYAISHGQAVGTGMAMITRAAEALGYCAAEDAERIVQLLATLGFALSAAHPTEDLVRAMVHDKKRSGHSITLVLPERIGSCLLKEVPLKDLPELIELGRGAKSHA